MEEVEGTIYSSFSDTKKTSAIQRGGFPGSSAGKEFAFKCRILWFDSWVRKIPWRKDGLSVPVFMGFPGVSDGKESPCNMGDLGLIPGLGRSPAGGHGNPSSIPAWRIPRDR